MLCIIQLYFGLHYQCLNLVLQLRRGTSLALILPSSLLCYHEPKHLKNTTQLPFIQSKWSEYLWHIFQQFFIVSLSVSCLFIYSQSELKRICNFVGELALRSKIPTHVNNSYSRISCFVCAVILHVPLWWHVLHCVWSELAPLREY